ncbi:hypothetical protein PMZ80_005677 [Knufia obscura]|uniref:polynucleotide adenylyltransferase n=1 Tax=Knufia obscura TaxID=1635080 RepID=A0ABR0RMA1_9EURO|nr:hypothetical protein PMZ80_005677 [Knufia obscura]
MSNKSTNEDERTVIEPETQVSALRNMSRSEMPDPTMAEAQSSRLSPASAKARSLPSTPSQRPHSPNGRRASPVTATATREASPQSLRRGAGRTPPTYRRGMICKYETGMKQARRRVPYTLGPEKLEPDPEGAAKRLNSNEELRITADMQALYGRLLPTNESETKRQKLVEKLEKLLKERWPGQQINVSVFGSTGNRLGTNDSDVDTCIMTDCKEIEHTCSIADLLARNGMERVVCVSSAKVPIVKVWDPDLQVACDMNVNNPIALENTELIRSYVAIDDRFRPLAMIVKYWAKRRILNDAALGGTLSSYTWICLVLNFLQTRSPPILPSLQQNPNLEPRLLGGVNVAFDKDLSKYNGFGKVNTSSLGELLFQFFHHYAHELDFEKSVMSVRVGKVIPKTQKAWHLLQDNRLCVEEPFNSSRNLGNTADDTSVRGIHLELRRACDLVAAGNLTECCEQYIPPQTEPLPRRTETFIQPTTKAIIPQPPPQAQPQPTRPGKPNYKRPRPHNNATRRSSNPPGRAGTHLRDLPPNHLRDLPFQMTPQELQLQAQHQQHLLHDQLFQQYQYLQLQEQELRLQLIRHRVAASGYSPSALSGADSMDEGQNSSIPSRTNPSSRMPLTAPLYQTRFNSNSAFHSNGISSSGIVTNPASPLLSTTVPDSRRYARRASVNSAAVNTLRAHSQPARVVPASNGLPYLSQRFDVPVRQVGTSGNRRSSVTSNPQDPLARYLASRMSQQGTRYDAGRRPVEYVGYYVGQSPSLSAHHGSATVSPIPSTAGLAIHNGGLSPRISARSSRLPSVSTSPASHYASVANGTSVMDPVTENGPIPESEPVQNSPPSNRSGPLIVDGSLNSPPRRQPASRPVRSSSEELDISVTTSEDAGLDTPSSSDDMSKNGSMRRKMGNGVAYNHLNGDVVHENDFLSLNGASTRFADPLGYEHSDPSDVLRKIEDERKLRELTTALAAATVNNGHSSHNSTRKHEAPTMGSLAGPPLVPMANGINLAHAAGPNGSQEWQTQSKKKKKNKKGPKVEAVDAQAGVNKGEAIPQNEELRKGG